MQCFPSPAKLIGLLTLTALMVGTSYFCTLQPKLMPQVMGWIGISFFGLCGLAFCIALGRSGPQVIIDERGIHDCRCKVGPIPWTEIRSVSLVTIQTTRYLGVELFDTQSYLNRLSRHRRWLAKLNQAFGYPTFAISFAGLSPGVMEVWAYLDQIHAQVKPDENPTMLPPGAHRDPGPQRPV